MVNCYSKASTPVEAYQKAWAYLAATEDRCEFVRHLDRVRFISYDQGAFTFEAETEHLVGLFSRSAENWRIRRVLELYAPTDVVVSVKVVLAEAVQHG